MSFWRRNSSNITIILLVAILAIIGYYSFTQFADYTYESKRHISDLMRAKLWSIFLTLFFAAILYWKRRSEIAPPLAVLAVSVYFIIIYAVLFRGTEYGLNGHWGDNGYRLIIVCKMMAYNYLADPTIKGLTGIYPPLYFYIMAIYAKILGLEAYQTIKFGYLFVFFVYPWLLYFSWRPLISKRAAAIVCVATIYFAHSHIAYVAYEHMTAALFIPWWLYFFEDGTNKFIGKEIQWKSYIVGALIGGALFMTYYYWYFIAAATLPLTVFVRYMHEKSWRSILQNLKHKMILMSGVALVSAVYWFPLLRSGFKYGFKSAQVGWFRLVESNLVLHWTTRPLEGFLVLLGVFFVAYFWNRWNHARLALYFCGALILIMLDRIYNLGYQSIQTRKIIQFAHVITIAPLAVGLELLWEKIKKNSDFQRGMVALAIILTIVFGDTQIENIRHGLYRTGVNQRVPTAELSVFENADCYGTVFLTNLYIESVYLPYFVFTPLSDVSANFGGQFYERKNYLKAISGLRQSNLLAYALTYNKYDKVDYFFLPYNGKTKCYELVMNTVLFNGPMVFDTVRFHAEAISDSVYFSKIQSRGLYKISAPKRDPEIDARLRQFNPEVYDQLSLTR